MTGYRGLKEFLTASGADDEIAVKPTDCGPVRRRDPL